MATYNDPYEVYDLVKNGKIIYTKDLDNYLKSILKLKINRKFYQDLGIYTSDIEWGFYYMEKNYLISKQDMEDKLYQYLNNERTKQLLNEKPLSEDVINFILLSYGDIDTDIKKVMLNAYNYSNLSTIGHKNISKN